MNVLGRWFERCSQGNKNAEGRSSRKQKKKAPSAACCGNSDSPENAEDPQQYTRLELPINIRRTRLDGPRGPMCYFSAAVARRPKADNYPLTPPDIGSTRRTSAGNITHSNLVARHQALREAARKLYMGAGGAGQPKLTQHSQPTQPTQRDYPTHSTQPSKLAKSTGSVAGPAKLTGVAGPVKSTAPAKSAAPATSTALAKSTGQATSTGPAVPQAQRGVAPPSWLSQKNDKAYWETIAERKQRLNNTSHQNDRRVAMSAFLLS